MTTPTTTTPPDTREQINAKLARAMGWRYEKHSSGLEWMPPGGTVVDWAYLPDFFTDAEASRSLVAWLAAQDGLTQDRFNAAIERAIAAYGFKVSPLQLACPLPAIALAAAAAIEPQEKA